MPKSEIVLPSSNWKSTRIRDRVNQGSPVRSLLAVEGVGCLYLAFILGLLVEVLDAPIGAPTARATRLLGGQLSISEVS